MQTTEEPRSVESLRNEALAYIQDLASRPALFGLTEAEAKHKAELSEQVLDIALALEVGQVLDLGPGMGWDGRTDQDRKLILDAVTSLAGQVRLLLMEFAHESLGKLPAHVVQAVLAQDEPYPYNGVELSKNSINIQWRRLPL